MFRSDEEFVKHIRDEVVHVLTFMKGRSTDDLESDIMLERAVTRCLEIMGEASKKVSQKYRERHPELPWREMTDTRNRVIHFYFGIDHEVIMNIVQEELPALLEKLEKLVGKTSDQM